MFFCTLSSIQISVHTWALSIARASCFAGAALLAAHTLPALALEGYQPAAYVIGQTDDDLSAPSPIFTRGGAHNGPNRLGLNYPYIGMALDPTGHRLFLSEYNNHRVLVYNLATDNTLLDRIPDNVLGQLNFFSNTANLTQAGMYYPAGIAYDDDHDRLFVTQYVTGTYNSSRLTVYDVSSITDGENAINVLGQPTFAGSTHATTQDGMNSPTDVVYDSADNRLFVAQLNNNRVTVYNLADGITDGEAATNVLGQSTFTAGGAANTQAGMNGPRGLAYDIARKYLFVSQMNSNRVTVYDVNAITNGEDAINVLGQTLFTGFSPATSLAGMNVPGGIAYDDSTQKLYVSQTTANRVTVYDLSTISNGEDAIKVLGQGSTLPTCFTTSTALTTQAGLNGPAGVLIDEGNQRLYVPQYGNHRVSVFDMTAIDNGESAIDLLGQYDNSLSSPDPVYTKSVANNGPSKLGYSAPHGMTIDGVRHRLFVADFSNNRVLEYDLTSANRPIDYLPDHVLGQANFYSAAAALTQIGMSGPTALAFDETRNRLFVSDYTNNRVVVFDTTDIADGAAATYVLGQVNFVLASAVATSLNLYAPRQLVFDAASNQLFVADSGNNRIMVFDVSTIINGESAINVIGQDDGTISSPQPIYTKGYANNAAHKLGFSNTNTGIALDQADHRLFLSDSSNHRVLVYELDDDNQLLDRVPDSVLGQSNFYSLAAARTQAGMNAPYGLAFDSAHQRLFVANYGSSRVTVYDTTTITNGENAVNVLGQSTFGGYTGISSQQGLNGPMDVVYDDAHDRLFVTEYSGNRVKIYNFTNALARGMNADEALGQMDGSADPQPIFTKSGVNNGPNLLGLNTPYLGIVTDPVHHRLFLSDTINNRVLVYGLNASNELLDRIPDSVIGQLNFVSNTAAVTQSGLNVPYGLAYDADRDRLFVAQAVSSSTARVTVYDTTVISNGENAVNVLGQASFTAAAAAVTQDGLYSPYGLAYDAATGRLFVAQPTASRVTVFDVNEITDGEMAINVLGQGNGAAKWTSSAAVTSQDGLNLPYSVALSGSTALFVSQAGANRVTVFNLADGITDGEAAINVLGQSTFVAFGNATTQAGMNSPRGIAYDSASKRLFVAQYNINRVTAYNLGNGITNGEDAEFSLGQGTASPACFTSATANTTQAGLNAPNGVFVDETSRRLYVPQSGAHRVSVFDISSLSNGEDALDVLGQYDDVDAAPSPAFTKGAANNTNRLGMNAPTIGLAMDESDHRLFVSDTGNNRVLVYNLNQNNELADRIPDNVLGQSNFASNAAATTQNGMNVPNGIAFDDAHDRLFVAQSGGNRVTVYDVAAITNGEMATSVIGQTNYTNTALGNSQNGINAASDVAYDSGGNRLFVAQSGGNRVTVYDVSNLAEFNQAATSVIGQADFAGATAATSQIRLNVPRGLALSGSTVLFVSQSSGNRVTTYNLADGILQFSEPAVNVIGQADYTAATAATTQTGLNVPYGLTYDGINKRLYVAQTTGNRVTVYDLADGFATFSEPAVNVFGGQSFTSATATITRDGLTTPNGALVDPANNRLYVVDAGAHRIVSYDLTVSIANYMNAVTCIGQANWTGANPASTQAGMNVPRSLAYDSALQRLFVSQSTGNRVTTYNVTYPTGEYVANAENVLGQGTDPVTKWTLATAAVSQTSLYAPAGLAFNYDPVTEKKWLFAAQVSANRVTAYDVTSLEDGEAAVSVLGQSTFISSTATTRQAGMSAPNGLLVDRPNNLLYVLQTGTNRVSVFNIASITDGEDAVNVLGQFDDNVSLPNPIYTKGTANNGPYKLGLSTPQGLAIDAGRHRLFVADSVNNRVLVYNLATDNTVSDRSPDFVLGQPNFYLNASAVTQANLSGPWALAFDAAKNQLFVSDNANNRIIIFDTASITNGENAIGVLGQPQFLTTTAATTQLGLSAPRQIHFDAASGQLFVADTTNNRIVVYTTTAAGTADTDDFYFYGF